MYIDPWRFARQSDPDLNHHFRRLWVEPARVLDVPPPPSVRWNAAELRHGAWVQRVRPVAMREVAR